jgi:multidrug resistance efflux pump
VYLITDGSAVIVDPESLTRCPDGQVGEVWVSGASVGQGYWNQPEQTKQAFQAYLADDDINPFFRTGDLGFLLNSELFITGRLKDLITIMGRNHYPQDIEMTVEKSHPALRPDSGAVFVANINNSEKLVVVQEVERSYLRKLNSSEVIEAIRKAVVEAHDLQAYAILLLKTCSLPKTSSGKVRRSACRQGFIDASLDVVADWSINPKNKSQFLHLELEVESLLQKLKEGDVQELTSESQNSSVSTFDNQQNDDTLSPLQIDLPLPATLQQEADASENVTLSKPQQKRNLYPLIFILFGLLIAGVGLLIWKSRVNSKEQLRASGRIEGYETDIGAKVGGRIQSVAVREGDTIRKGQLLVKLDDAEIQAQLLGAVARVDASQQQEQQARLQINLIESQIEETQLSLQQSQGDAQGKIFQFSSSLASTQAQFNQAQAQLEQAKSELKLAKLNRDRFSSLVAQGAVTKQQFDEAQTRWETARSTVESQQAAVDSFRKLVNSAQGQLSRSVQINQTM